MKINLTKNAHAALWYALSAMQPRGRSEVRLHAKAQRPARQLCKSNEDDGGDMLTFKAGTIEIPSKEAFEYLKKDVIDKILEEGPPATANSKQRGISGLYAEGFQDLLDAIEAAEKAAAPAEPAKTEPASPPVPNAVNPEPETRNP